MTQPPSEQASESGSASAPPPLAVGLEHGVFYLSLTTTLGAGVSALIGYLAGQPGWLPSLLSGWVVCGVAAALAWVLIALPDRVKPGSGVPMMAPILATTVRLLVSVTGVAVILEVTALPRLPLILTALAAYLVLMAAEAYLLYLTRPVPSER
ncbi:hypothetical protein [Mucisphaera sp.]|uniref:hypothetical protein n=1 Tax=Mucisphaera sp. TaxID=2913024 RepID=UPI003D143A22